MSRTRCRQCSSYIGKYSSACSRHMTEAERVAHMSIVSEMAKMRRAGATWKVIGAEYGMYPGTAREFVVKHAPDLRSFAHAWRSRGIVEKAAIIFDTTSKDIVSSARFQHIVYARHAAAKVLREYGLSYPFIGSVLGGRDHSSIIFACNKADILAERDPIYADRLAQLRAAA